MIRKIPTLIFLFFISCYFIFASDIINYGALNSKIIVLHFDDGYVRYHQKGESRTNEWVISEPLDISKVNNVLNFEIKSATGFYSIPQNPVKIERKSKGTEFTWLCESYSQSVGCINGSQDHAKEHFVYLHLPESLELGKTYTVSTGDVANNGKTWEFEFSLEKNRSEAIHVNLLGYDPQATQKYGYVYHWSGSGGSVDFSTYNEKNFYLINTQTKIKEFTGTLKFRKSKNNAETNQPDTPNKNFNGADVYDCDFSGYSTPGEYILAVDKIGCSFPFKIEKDVYRLAFYTSIRGLYHNRSGIDLVEPYTNFTRPAPHNPLITTNFAGKLKYTTSRFVDWNSGDHSALDKPAIENGILGSINTWGWYQDAGDWDGYFSHMKVPAMLMLTWEIASEKFADGELNLPEGTNQIPDILDEAAWLIRFFHRTRHELINKGYGTGGMGSRIAPDWFGNEENGTPSYLDSRQWIISGEDPFTTYFYAGLAAHYALILNKLGKEDPDSINWFNEAEEAYNWAKNNTKANDLVRPKVHNLRLSDYEMYAAANLYRLTGNVDYLNIVLEATKFVTSNTVLEEDQKWGIYSLITGTENEIDDETFLTNIKGAIIKTADQKFESIDKRACRFGGNMWMPMLVGQGTTPRVFEIMMGHFVSKEFAPAKTEKYLAGIYTTADYFLGSNPQNMTWVTHLGVRYPERLMHLDSWYRDGGEIVPGITPYGPWRNEGSGPVGPWDVRWPNKTIFPEEIDNWPGHERWFNNYTTPSNAEFTIHQNTILSAVVYGYLCTVPDGSFNPNNKPTVEIVAPVKSAKLEGNVIIEVNASDPDGIDDIAWVEFYTDWHKIGQSNEAPFSFTWEKPKYGLNTISAKIVDKRGFSSKSENVDIEVTPLNYNVTIAVLDSMSHQPIGNCSVSIFENKILTNNYGEAFFGQVSGLLNLKLEKEKYSSININQLSIYSDTTLTFYLAPHKNDISIIVHDQRTSETFEGAGVTFNSEKHITNENGEVFFQAYNGDYNFLVEKLSFLNESGSLTINSDTVLHVFLIRTHAEIKFVLKEGTTPVNNATVVLNEDSLLSTSLGIAKFKGIEVATTNNYKIVKTGYKELNGTLILIFDTTVNIAMEAIPVGLINSQEKKALKIWPNPAIRILNISSFNTIESLVVSNLAGTYVLKQNNLFLESLNLDITGLVSGMYFLEINHLSGNPEIIKFIKN